MPRPQKRRLCPRKHLIHPVDATVDPILVDISYWLSAIRPDQMPEVGAPA